MQPQTVSLLATRDACKSVDCETLMFKKSPEVKTPSFLPVLRIPLVFLQVARFLEVGVALDTRSFPAFKFAFVPADIEWDVPSAPIMQRAREIQTGVLHATP